MRDHTSWAQCVIEIKIRGILKSWFWISRHQGTLSILCSRIQSYMLSLMNEVDLCLLLPLCILYEMQNQNFQQLVSEQSSISCLYNMWLCFRIKEKPFSWCFYFLHNCVFESICYVLYMRYICWIQFFMEYLLVTVSTLLVLY